MPWITFVKDYDFPLRRSVILAANRGDTLLVTRERAQMAKAAGAAIDAERPDNGKEIRRGRSSR